MSYSEEDQPFVHILKAMGIAEFDPLVPVALNEYAASELPTLQPRAFLFCLYLRYFGHAILSGFASEILKDAKDYSNHAGRSVTTALSNSDPHCRTNVPCVKLVFFAGGIP